MIGLPWLTLKQAQDALRAGRLDEAHQLLVQPQVQGHRRHGELLQQLLRGYVERGEKHLRNDDATNAWSDLLKAEQLAITDNSSIKLRQALTRLGLAEVRAKLDAGEPARALESINQLRERAVRQSELDPLEEAAKGWTAAMDYMERGEFAQASQVMERVARLLPAHTKAVQRFGQTIERRNHEFTPLLFQLHEAARVERWQQVLELTEKMLALAPQHGEARRLRGRAWRAVEPSTVVVTKARPKPSAPKERDDRRRYILWIDGVGGFLMLLDNVVTIGQAGPETTVDIPLIANVSRLHARISRDAEGYVFEALRPVTVNNESAGQKLLQSGDRVTLGNSCQFMFRQDAPVSASARLDLVSGHRFGNAVDGVLLMAETLILGPEEQSHVHIPQLGEPVILFRNKDELWIRSNEEFYVNGHLMKGRSVLEAGGHVTHQWFSLSLEAI